MNQEQEDKEDLMRQIKAYHDFYRGNAIAALVGIAIGLVMVTVFIIHDLSHH